MTEEISLKIYLKSEETVAQDTANKLCCAISYDIVDRHQMIDEEKSLSFSFTDQLTSKKHLLKTSSDQNNNSLFSTFNLSNWLSHHVRDSEKYLEAFMKDPVSLDIESYLILQNHTVKDEISVYVEWRAIEGSILFMDYLNLINHLLAQNDSSVKREMGYLKGRVIRGDSHLKEALLAMFPSGQLQNMNLEKFLSER